MACDCTPLSGSLSLRLRLSKGLASPHTTTRRFILQKTRRACPHARHLAGPWFQVLFHSPRRGSFRLSLTVLFAIGGAGYSALDRGRPGFARGSSCPALLRYRTTGPRRIPHTGLSPSPARLSGLFRYASRVISLRVIPVRPYNPGLLRFGLLPVRSPLLGESLLISSPALLRWFTSRSLAPPHYLIHARGMCLAAHGLPHSATPESMRVCRSPGPFVACHGLRRPRAPRHPPTGPNPLGHIVAPAPPLALPRAPSLARGPSRREPAMLLHFATAP